MKLHVFRMPKFDPIPVGTIETSGHSTSFRYLDSYANEKRNMPLSYSMPLRAEAYLGSSCDDYFAGLLPEESARDAIARHLGVGSKSYLAILKALGQECVGDVVIATDETPLITEPHYVPLEEATITRLACGSIDAATSLLEQSHLSLAGAQYKVGLYRDESKSDLRTSWYAPAGSAPSTHIIKLPNNLYPQVAINEFLCMRLAKHCGLNTPDLFLFGGDDPLLAIKRFDRVTGLKNQTVDGFIAPMRLHQQDMCQALGVSVKQKYETAKFGYVRKMSSLLGAVSTSPEQDKMALARLTIFNFLIGNADNHLKNFSIVSNSETNSVRLSPPYDLVSTTMYPNLTRYMGVRIGGQNNIDKIAKGIIANLARDISVSKDTIQEIVNDLVHLLPNAYEIARGELSETDYWSAGESFADNSIEDILPRLGQLRSEL